MTIRAVEGAPLRPYTRMDRQTSGHMNWRADGRSDGDSDNISVVESALMATQCRRQK